MVCLIKLVIIDLPRFFPSFFQSPKIMTKEIRKIQRQILWGWGTKEKKIAWVN